MRQLMISDALQAALADHKFIRLDMGCGVHKTEGFYGIDMRPHDGVDLVHDVEVVPYPLPDGCAQVILASHLVEHLKPWLIFDIMDEWWRLLVPGGSLLLAMPYPTSPGFHQDPTHIHSWNETTPHYFDPACGIEQCVLYHGLPYKPKPWKIEKTFWDSTGNIEFAFSKREVS